MKKILMIVFLLALIGCEDGKDGKNGIDGLVGPSGMNGCDSSEVRDSTLNICIADEDYVDYLDDLQKHCESLDMKLVWEDVNSDGFTIIWYCEVIPEDL